jgi:membrane-associated phospholipid phosphatase
VNRELPIFISWKWKWPAGFGVCALAVAIYLLTNHFHIVTPMRLSLTFIDRMIPFVPLSVWIYLSGVFFLPVAYCLNRCVVGLNKHLFSFTALIIGGGVIFEFCPTEYPRELFPLPAGTDWLTSLAWRTLRGLDTSANCAPSLHVAISFLVAFGFLDDRQKWFPAMFAWALLLAASTLTTKQHYFLDVMMGVSYAMVVFAVFHRVLRYRLLISK